eukprot:SAG22_NODE_2597_length_2402_cov_1.862788_3_plen_400_part_00
MATAAEGLMVHSMTTRLAMLQSGLQRAACFGRQPAAALSCGPTTGRSRLAPPSSCTGRRAMGSVAAASFGFDPHFPILAYGTDGPADRTSAQCTQQEMVGLFVQMERIRRMEIACENLYRGGEIRGLCYLADGMEAMVTGIEAALATDDAVSGYFRCHAWPVVRAENKVEGVRAVFAEALGRATGCSSGKSGSMHMYAAQHKFYGGQSTKVSHAQIATATGNALAFKYHGSPQVAVACFEQGGAKKGVLFESMNMAALWKLPIVYVCEGLRDPNRRCIGQAEFHAFQCGHSAGVPGLCIDGLDVLCVKACAEFAIAHCRAGKGPFVLELDGRHELFGRHPARWTSAGGPSTNCRTRDENNEGAAYVPHPCARAGQWHPAEVRWMRDPILQCRNCYAPHP